MIFIKLFLSFLMIGIFTFGGGYSMIALIQNEVVVRNSWITSTEFTDLLAISQMTPGPIGINTATYVGYTATVNAGYSAFFGVLGAIISSFSVILLPIALVIIISRILIKGKDNPLLNSVFKTMRVVVVGLIAAAALSLFTTDNFGTAGLNTRFLVSIAIFLAVFLLSYLRKCSPILLIISAGVVGGLTYGILNV